MRWRTTLGFGSTGAQIALFVTALEKWSSGMPWAVLALRWLRRLDFLLLLPIVYFEWHVCLSMIFLSNTTALCVYMHNVSWSDVKYITISTFILDSLSFSTHFLITPLHLPSQLPTFRSLLFLPSLFLYLLCKSASTLIPLPVHTPPPNSLLLLGRVLYHVPTTSSRGGR